MDGLMDGWMDKWKGARADICVDAWMYVWDGYINASMHRCMDMKQMHVCMLARWMDGWMDGWSPGHKIKTIPLNSC